MKIAEMEKSWFGGGNIELSDNAKHNLDVMRKYIDANKIKSGLIKACEKRPVSLNQIENICLEIEREIQNSLAQEVRSEIIGEKVMLKLKPIDEVSYVRFASVYRQFKDITNFIKFLNEI